MKKSKGLGDTIENITSKTGIKKLVKAIAGDDCGCEERKNLLNQKYPNIKNVREYTKDEKKIHEEVIPIVEKTNQITPEQRTIIGNLYKSVFKSNAVFGSCGSCNKKVIKNLKRIYEKSCNV